MKVILFLFIPLILKPQTAKVIWDYNDDADSVIYYNVFTYSSKDTLYSPFNDITNADSIRGYFYGSADNDSLKAIYTADTAIYIFTINHINGKYAQVALTAVNAYGESEVAYSSFAKIIGKYIIFYIHNIEDHNE